MSAADKLKKYRAFQTSEINRLQEIHEICERALADKKYHTAFKSRFAQLEAIKGEFDRNYSGILNLLALDKDADLDAEYAILRSFEKQYYAIQTTHTDLFEKDDNRRMSLLHNTTSVVPSHINLPKIELAKFSGDIKAFPSFIQLYDALIHTNESLSDIEKFNYLLSSLKGPPLSMAQYLPMLAGNYKVVYDNLVKRYSNKRLLANAYFSELENAPKISSDSVVELRKLLDSYQENLAALRNLEFPVDHWDFILSHMLMKRLDGAILTRFELHHGSTTTIPTYAKLVKFLENHCVTLEQMDQSSSRLKNKKIDISRSPHSSKPQHRSAFCATASKPAHSLDCCLCKSSHVVSKCPQFIEKIPQERYQLVRQFRLCLNCLSAAHSIKQCSSNFRCRTCHSKHHSMLHFSRKTEPQAPSTPVLESASHSRAEELNPAGSAGPSTSFSSLSGFVRNKNGILLSTALIEVRNSRGIFEKCRALLDSGAQLSFISQKCAHRLGIRQFDTSMSVQGLCQTPLVSQASGVDITLRPVGKPTPTFDLSAIVLPKICSDLPSAHLDIEAWPHLCNVTLADPKFNCPGPIDLLLGADIFPLLLTSGRILGAENTPIAINTVFGYILMGNTQQPTPIVNSFFCSVDSSSLENLVTKFWQLENVPEHSRLSPDDVICEKYFLDSHCRTDSGRFVVSLPFRDNSVFFPNTKQLAINRFLSLERRLVKNPSLHLEYSNFLREYLELGHMERVSDETVSDNAFYIPHHCVLRPESPTTKLRVVFDASMKASNGISLNDSLLAGPKLQRDIVTILLNFRLHNFVFTADIKQMYRQILVNPNQVDYQRIVWRFSPREEIQIFRLLTVTYGVNCAPYLAIRVLQQLAEDGASRFPLAAAALKVDTYMDDIVTGSDTLEEATLLQNQLIGLLKEGGFELRKWASNDASLLSTLPSSHSMHSSLSFDKEESLKILGLKWYPANDVFSFNVQTLDKSCTKRSILSELARVFDPLGILTPVTFFTKHLIQRLWCLGLGWDDTPPPDILRAWQQYRAELSRLSDIHLARRIAVGNLRCELHGFCDASEKGYAAVSYIRALDSDDNVSLSFLCAKSRVAPLKRISIPKLELCAAVLLADLLSFCLSVYSSKIQFHRVCAWSDSMVAISWIKSSPHRWQTFVSNRVAHIQEKLSPTAWYHVSSLENPADCASRGLFPSELVHHSLWWGGPDFLYRRDELWLEKESNVSVPSEALEEERKITLTTLVDSNILDELLEKHSSLETIKRVVAYMVRFIRNLRNPSQRHLDNFLSLLEMRNSIFVLVSHVQRSHFSQDIVRLKKRLSPSKPLRRLNVFLDEQNILRVGGRLYHSQLGFDKKHPILLPRSCRLTQLLIENVHIKYLHAGPRTVQSILAQQFWILSPKRAIRSVLTKCVRCWRTNPTPLQPLMGNLPAVRVSQLKPFLHVGVDYAGPLMITVGRVRGAVVRKAYLCLFVCMATKAVHLELVSDMTAEAFLAGLRRFVARRGRCSKIYSDCGSNFVKAHKELSSYMKLAAGQVAIDWHFNAPSSPHMGGLWESGVRSVKTHLKRVIGEQILTYEELYTVLVQIEAILNSRPLTALSSDPNDLSALTPGHFLTLEPLTAVPDADVTGISLSRLSRWQLLQRMHQSFWVRWHSEYLHTLQQRGKWLDPGKAILPGVLVLIKVENLPPLQWQLGRVTETHPGADGIVRVVSVRTSTGIFKRPVVKLCPLPVD